MGGASAALRAAAGGSGTAAVAAAAAAGPEPAVPPKVLNLVIPHIDGRLLLGRKLRGFGEGYVNGFGGKVERGESIEESARREVSWPLFLTASVFGGLLAGDPAAAATACAACDGCAPAQPGLLPLSACSWLPDCHRCQPNRFFGCLPAPLPACPPLQLLEEAGIVATAMQHCGLLHFIFDDRPQPWEVHGELGREARQTDSQHARPPARQPA